MKGANTINAAGNYGVMGISAPSNVPGAREGSATWTDQSGNLWLFGGHGYGSSGTGRLGDMWKWNTTTNEWTWIKGSNLPNSLAVYGTKGVANPLNIPGARSFAATWTDNSGFLWMFGGYGYDGLGNVNDLNDLWKYNTATNEWTWVSGTDLTLQYGVYGTQGVGSVLNIPGARRHHVSWKDNSGALWLFSGYGLGASGAEDKLNDLWKYNTANNEWTWVKGSTSVNQLGTYGTQGTSSGLNTPGARYGSVGWASGSDLYMFGGAGYGSAASGFLNDVWKFNTGSGQWTWLKGSSLVNQTSIFGTATLFAINNGPGGRHFPVLWPDASGNAYLQGGNGNSLGGQQHLNDMWKYDISINQWTFIRGVSYEVVGNYGTLGTVATSNDPGSGFLRNNWKDGSGNFWLHGGEGYDMNANFSFLSEMWKMNTCAAPAPVNVSASSNLHICNGNLTSLTAVSGTNPVTWYSSPTGTSIIGTGTVYNTPALPSPTTSTSYTYYASATNTCGVSNRAPIVATSYSVYPTITTGTTYTQTMNIGNLQTINSNWSPAIFNFTDPLPPGAIITGIDLTYDGKDQGLGGTGAPADLYVTDVRVASTALYHTWNPYSTSFTGPISTYVYGGANTFKFYFWGYPAWQGFLNNVVLTFRYQTKTPPPIVACQSSSLTLKAYGGVTYTWSGGAIDNVPHELTGTQIYTVTGANVYGCTNTATIQVNATPAPTVSLSGPLSVCAGGSFTQTASVAGASDTFSWSTGAVTSSISATPTVSTLYKATATNTTSGCFHSVLRKVTVNAIPTITTAVSSATLCAGSTVSLAVTTAGSSGALNFDGVDDYVETGVAATELGQGDFTIEAWIKTTGFSQGIVTCLNNNTSWDSGEKAFYLDALGIPTFVGFNNNYIIGNIAVNDGQWHHVAVVWDYASGTSGTGYIYVDGVNHTSISTYAANVNNLGTFKIGQGNYNNYTPEAPNNFSGLIDDVRIWSVVRSQALISGNMNSCLTGSESGLKSYYRFEDGAGSSKLADQSIYDYHATLTNMNVSTAWFEGRSNCFSGYSYLWTPGSFATQSVSTIPGGTTQYTVTATNGFGCTGTTLSNVTVNPLPVVSVNSGTICSGDSYTISPSGASTYTFLSGAAVVSPTISASYSVAGSSSVGCVSAPAVSGVTVYALPTINVNSGGICPGNIFTMSPSGALTYTYTGGSNTVSPGTATNYSVTGTDLNGCISSVPAVANVTIHPVPIIAVNSGTVCSGYPFTLVPSGAITYTYSGGSAVVNPLITSSYSVTGTNSLGCISPVPAIANITAYQLPTVTVNSGTVCLGSTFTITPGGANTYNFITGASTVSPLSNMSYSVTGTSIEGCAAGNTVVASVTVVALPVVVISGTTALCYGSSITLTASGASGYSWNTGPVTNTITLSPSGNTTYSVTGTDAVTGCSNIATQAVVVNPLPVVTVNSGTICSGFIFTMLPAGAASYVFSNGSSTVAPLTNSSYSVTGTDALGCVSASPAVATILAYPNPTVAANSGTICQGASFTITPSGANTYMFLNGSAVVSPASSTTYSIVGTSVNGCVSSSPGTSTITVNPLPPMVISGPNAVCSGSAITQTVTGADTYLWNTGSTSTLISISPTVATLYNVTGSNTLTGCTNTISKLINIGTPPVITVNSGNICEGSPFTMVPSGAATYTFSNGSSTVLATVSPTSNTSYFVSGTSALGCISTASAVANVFVNAAPVIAVNSGGICAGGVFTMMPTGANSYTYSSGSATVNPSASQNYSVTGTNVLGCISLTPAVAHVTVNALPSIVAPNGTVCAGSNYSIVPTGAASYTYFSPAGQVSPWVSPAANTNYSVTGTTAQGCVSPAPTVITVSVIALPVIAVNSGTVCSGSTFVMTPTGAFTYSYSSGSSTVVPTGNSSYSVTGTSSVGCVSPVPAIAQVTLVSIPVVSVSNGVICVGQVYTITPSGALSYSYTGNSATVSPTANTSYTVTGTNTQGCASANLAVCNVIVNPSPTLAVIGNKVICDGESTTLFATGANSYTWNGGPQGSTQSFTPSVNTTYTVSGTNSNFCVGSQTTMITVNTLPVITLNTGTVCPNGSFTIIPSGAVNYTFSGGSDVVIPSVTTSYSVTGTDVNGCSSAIPAVTTITVINAISISVSGNTLVCAGDPSTLSVTGAVSYTWHTGEFTNTIVPSPTTNSTYTVMGANGTCRDTAFISVQVKPLPAVLLSSTPTLVCAGESVTLTPSGADSYVWGGGETSAELVVNPAATTVYTVTGTGSNGCVAKITLTQKVSDCVGLDQNVTKPETFIKLYPNPNTGEFVIETPVELKIIVRNALGQLVAEKQLDQGINRIILDNQAKGLYFVEFGDNRQAKPIKVVKQ